jgi:hypothetical protein
MVMPSGVTEYRGGRGRGVFGGGYSPSPVSYNNTIDYVTISTLGNAQDFGDLTAKTYESGGCASSTRGIFAGGENPSGLYSNIISYITISSTGNAFDFGDIDVNGRRSVGCVSSQVRGIIAGGWPNPSLWYDSIKYITISSLGDASDFGSLISPIRDLSTAQSPTRGVLAGGSPNNTASNATNTIQYITISSIGNAQDFGDLTQARTRGGGGSNSIRGLFAGGYNPTYYNIIDYVTIASTGSAIDFGDLTLGRFKCNAATTSSRAVFSGGYTAAPIAFNNTIDYVTIATTGNALDFGDATTTTVGRGTFSDAHGGLGD